MSERNADGLGTQLRRLQELLDGELEKVYRMEHSFYTPRYTPIMKALAMAEPLSIKQIAEQSSVSHSAASQTVAKLQEHGLVVLDVHSDRRSRVVRLSAEGRRLLPWLQTRWRATTQAALLLDQELTHPLRMILAEAIERLEAQSFSDRIAEQVTALERAAR
ncbi:MAG: MarR family transcriptional regulator [Myxococcota bacterium]